jgi:hypothetical protein
LGIAAGPDGNLWFADGGSTRAIGRIAPATQAISEFSAGLNAGSAPLGIAAGPDGNLWITDLGTTKAIGRITPATHVISEFSAALNAGSYPEDIAAGADGSLWFSDPSGTTGAIGRITTAGAINEFSAGLSAGSFPGGIAAGPDGNLWFTAGGTRAIGRITTPPTAVTVSATATGPTSAAVSGTANGHAQPASFHVEYGPVGGASTTTAERSLGTTSRDTPVSVALTGLMPTTAYQARVVVTNPTDTTPGAFRSFTTAAVAPALSGLTLSPAAFRAAPSGPSALAASATAATKKEPGTLISYRDSQTASTTFTVLQSQNGVRKGKRCVEVPKRREPKRKPRRCERLVVLGTFTHTDRAGSNRLRFTGRVRGGQLKPGPYQLRAIARNSARTTSRPVTKGFRIER